MPKRAGGFFSGTAHIGDDLQFLLVGHVVVAHLSGIVDQGIDLDLYGIPGGRHLLAQCAHGVVTHLNDCIAGLLAVFHYGFEGLLRVLFDFLAALLHFLG
ncbi:hypothetical protein SAMN05428936_106128 [Pelagibacterium halotolerans]|nr:hypothetical protein SAMN05428936_106128 [Pelagibacterium halotolerans]